jgi:DNA-binding MurR/RpiR family transcriptional regulator
MERVVEMSDFIAFNHRINSRLDQLTKSERKVASYLLQNFEEAAFFSAAELAEQMSLSEATVVRFAQAIGFSGFPELRQCLQDLFKEKVSHAYRLRKKLAELRPGAHILEQVVGMEIEYLTDAMRTISQQAFDQAVELICGARRLFVYGLSGSALLAELLEHRLRRFGVEVVPLTQSGREVAEGLLMLGDGDVFLAMIFFNLPEVTVSALEYVRQCDCQVILLTDTQGTHLRDKVDVLLEARRGPVMAFHSLIVPMAIIQALIIAVAEADEEKSMATLDRLDDIRERLGFAATARV